MGTRHLIAVQLDGQYRIAQYGQWDGYPSGQGADILEFLKSMNRPVFEEKLRALSFLTDEEVDALNKQGEALGWSTFYHINPHLSRDAGAKVLRMVHHEPAGKLKLRDSISFASDSLFCEYAYVIDLDKDMLEVFGGFRTEPLPSGERFSDAPLDADNDRRSTKYYPVKLAAAYPLSALPDVDMMQRDVDPPEAEDAA